MARSIKGSIQDLVNWFCTCPAGPPAPRAQPGPYDDDRVGQSFRKRENGIANAPADLGRISRDLWLVGEPVEILHAHSAAALSALLTSDFSPLC
jgi:hypothetical protein